MSYSFLKLIHILSATAMIGTGLGSAFYLYFTYKNKTAQIATLVDVIKLVIVADKIFTLPSVIIQLITGLMLADAVQFLWTTWFYLVIGVSFVVLVLWLRAAWIQIKLKAILEHDYRVSDRVHSYMKEWFYLGIFSFSGAMVLYYLMVFKPLITK